MTAKSLPTSLLPKADDSPWYHYFPTESICIMFVCLFAFSTFVHICQTFRYRIWWLFPTAVLCGLAETLGWSGRLWSSQDALRLTPYLIQISTTIIAPTPLVAANFLILGTIIRRLGSRYSRLSPKWYTIIFCSCDVLSLVVQAVGGATASFAVQNGGNPTKGGHIMLAGIVIQMIAITVYTMCATEFFLRFLKDKPVRGDATSHKFEEGSTVRVDIRMKIMVIALTFTTTCLFIRAVYRTIELANGWHGRIISTQVYFNVLDGGMITLAMYTLNLIHPGIFLHGGSSDHLAEGKKKHSGDSVRASD